MIKTSYFAKYKEPDGVSIAVGTPPWFSGSKCPSLFPTWGMLNEYKTTGDWELYKSRYYDEVLSKLDPREIADALEGKVMLCWERPNQPCHRQLVAQWLFDELGIEVKEIE